MLSLRSFRILTLVGIGLFTALPERASAAALEPTYNYIYACGDISFSWNDFRLTAESGNEKNYITLSRAGTPVLSSESIYLNLSDSWGQSAFPSDGLVVGQPYILRGFNSRGKLLAESSSIELVANSYCSTPSVRIKRLDRKNRKLIVEYSGFPVKSNGDYSWLAVAEKGTPNSQYLDFVSLRNVGTSYGEIEIQLVKSSTYRNLELRSYFSWRPGILNYRVGERVDLPTSVIHF